jgi:hypothetical protein
MYQSTRLMRKLFLEICTYLGGLAKKREKLEHTIIQGSVADCLLF